MNFLRKEKRKSIRKITPIKITYFTCMHGRSEISTVFMDNYERLKNKYAAYADFRLVAAVSDDESMQLMAGYQSETVAAFPCNNNPVGTKWNYALMMALQSFGDSEYFIKADDDGLLTDEGFEALLEAMKEKHPYIGFNGEVFCSPLEQKAAWFQYPEPTKVMGTLKAYSAECIHRAATVVKVRAIQDFNAHGLRMMPGESKWFPFKTAIDLVNHSLCEWQPVNGQIEQNVTLWERAWDRNLDFCSDLKLLLNHITAHAVHTEKPALINIKIDGKNIWPFEMRANEGQPYRYDTLKELLTHEDWLNLYNLNVLFENYYELKTDREKMTVV